jgi:hypothetical protein
VKLLFDYGFWGRKKNKFEIVLKKKSSWRRAIDPQCPNKPQIAQGLAISMDSHSFCEPASFNSCAEKKIGKAEGIPQRRK